jgi:hypothetical protein
MAMQHRRATAAHCRAHVKMAPVLRCAVYEESHDYLRTKQEVHVVLRDL